MNVALRDCCFNAEETLAPFEAARQVAMTLAKPHGRVESVSLADAKDRVLTMDIEAPCSLPPFDQAAMDGYAISLSERSSPPSVLPVTGRTNAGDPPGVLRPDTAHRVSTGAALPLGADTVVMQEQVTRNGNFVQFDSGISSGTHIRRAGEDVKQGSIVLRRGCRIGWPEIALLAALGIERVKVAAAVRIAIVTTGSELQPAGKPLTAGAIYDANGPMLAALLDQRDAVLSLSSVNDDILSITRALEEAAESADLVVTTAGMSESDRDHVRAAVQRAGGQLDVVKVAMKPGKPLALGRLKRACFIGLPGNPQAAAFGALAFVRPMMMAVLGEAAPDRLTALSAFSLSRPSDRTELVPVRLGVKHCRLTAHRSGATGSHRLAPFAGADAVAIVPHSEISLGMAVEILPFDRLRFGNSRDFKR